MGYKFDSECLSSFRSSRAPRSSAWMLVIIASSAAGKRRNTRTSVAPGFAAGSSVPHTPPFAPQTIAHAPSGVSNSVNENGARGAVVRNGSSRSPGRRVRAFQETAGVPCRNLRSNSSRV